MTARRNLQPAHKGYRYQDIVTAYVLIRSMVEQYGEVTVDNKRLAGDCFDDVEVHCAGRVIRRQLKSSDNTYRSLAESDFVASSSSVRIDLLVLTDVRTASGTVDEYRLCATWSPPPPGDQLWAMLEPIEAAPTLAGWPSSLYRLRGDVIWPDGSAPVWSPLAPYAKAGAAFGRNGVLAFLERFIIELALPLASLTLEEPGPLERAVVDQLGELVGIGRYPNQGRTPSDVAALAISLANLARTQGATLRPADVERALEIRTDFGRVAQTFPVDQTYFHDRPNFRQSLAGEATAGRHQLVIGPPGAGKSWELTRLAEELTNTGAIVARHYCYLEPGDALVERRVTTDVLIGNLLAEIFDAAPTLRQSGVSRYSATLTDLESVLKEASDLGHAIVLIIDGIDHIARVRSEASDLSDAETDIVEKLSILRIPSGVALIVGSQPGTHLAPFRERWGDQVTDRYIPPWSNVELIALLERYQLIGALAIAGIRDNEDIDRVRASLADRIGGNPLYARYLAIGLVAGIKSGAIANVDDWVAEAPVITGDIAVYYAYLYRKASTEAQAIADLLGVIDFSVTEQEVRAILPPMLRGWVSSALERLAPILTSSVGQGGVRIFHESFRRFMIGELARQNRSLADCLEPVITWLDARGFLQDAKSYRFLLPALRRASRGQEALARITSTFVSDSVVHAHQLSAVQRNLALAADVAASDRNWPALVRCVELHRAAYSCFEYALNDWSAFWATYLELFGPVALAERMLFDGRITLGKSDGLRACSLIDDAGATAPWREYLTAEKSGENGEHDTFDSTGALTSVENDRLATIHGLLRLGRWFRVVRWLLGCLGRCDDNFSFLFFRALAFRLARMLGMSFVERIAGLSQLGRRGGARMTARAGAAMYLGLADEYARNDNPRAAATAATSALAGTNSPEIAIACVRHGASQIDASRVAINPASISIGVGPDEYIHKAHEVRAWVASVRLLAGSGENAASVLDAECSRVGGVGWYRCWLKFVLALARAEAAQRVEQPYDLGVAFAELTKDVRPFSGNPRACDLYAIRRVIAETIGWAMSLLRTEEEWRTALDAIQMAALGTRSQLDIEDGGPVPIGTLLDLLSAYAKHPSGGELVVNAIEGLVAQRETSGAYYPALAEYSLRLARVRHAVGNVARAKDSWDRAALFFSCYGQRKDVTVFDLIESIPALAASSPQLAIDALSKVQPLVDSVINHTDRKSTKHAPNTWLSCLLEVRPEMAMFVLAQTLALEDAVDWWPLTQGIRDAAERVKDISDPVLVDGLLATLSFEVDHESEAKEVADSRLGPVVRMAASDKSLAGRALRRVLAEVANDGCRYTTKAMTAVVGISKAFNLPIPIVVEFRPVAQKSQEVGSLNKRRQTSWRFPAFVPDPTVGDLLTGLRAAEASRHSLQEVGWDTVVLSLSYHLGGLVDDGKEEDAQRIVRFIARDLFVSPGLEHPLGKLATALDNAGYTKIASITYALAYSATRGGGGYLRMGGREHGYLLERGVTLDAELTRQVVGEEIAYALRGNYYSVGTSRHLVEQLAAWGDVAGAEASWGEAFSVVSRRLPMAPDRGWFVPLCQKGNPGWTVDESLVALLLARTSHPGLWNKVSALSAVAHAIRRQPQTVAAPLRWYLTFNSPSTSVLLIFQVLVESEASPFELSRSLEDVLRGYAACAHWGLSRLAATLLSRSGAMSVPPTPPLQSTPTRSSSYPLSARRLQDLLTMDVGNVLEDLESVWPALTRTVLTRFNELLTSNDFPDRARTRLKFAHGRDLNRHPAVPTLFWEREFLELALHEHLCDLSAHLWSTGQWTKEAEEAILLRVLPATRLHLGISASRTVRPPWPHPVESVTGARALVILGGDDPSYTGWVRLAMVESEYLASTSGRQDVAVECVTIFSGVVAKTLGTELSSDFFPLRDASAEEWWSTDAPEVKFPYCANASRVAGIARQTDWLGEALVLIPPLALRNYLGLHPTRYADPMAWLDREGQPGIVLRTWRVLGGDRHDALPIIYEGSDLIVRADIFDRLDRLYSSSLVEMSTTVREAIV